MYRVRVSQSIIVKDGKLLSIMSPLQQVSIPDPIQSNF